MENSNFKIVASPWIPVDTAKYCTYVCPEGLWQPLEDGTWPLVPFEFTNWVDEELSYYDNCYIHGSLNPFLRFYIKGKDFPKLLSNISVSTFNNFPVGKARHTIICMENGKILMDGIVVRLSEDEFHAMCLPDPNMFNQGKYDITTENITMKSFFYQLCGPRSLEVVEAAAQDDLHDIKFMYMKNTKIKGKDVWVLRTGMAGTLGYEVHGKAEDAIEVYNALMEAGKPLGIKELGRHAYRNAHTEGSIPQMAFHFAAGVDGKPVTSGSLDPKHPLVYRSPIECGWEKMINFNHEFPGKAALQAELAGPHYTGAHLVWDVDDVMKVMRTAFEKESCDIMDVVEDYTPIHAAREIHLDEVYDGSKMIGASSGRMLSPKTKEMISVCTIDMDYAVEGKVVEILWGTPGTRQERIKAKVSLFPYINKDRNENFDVETIPHPVF